MFDFHTHFLVTGVTLVTGVISAFLFSLDMFSDIEGGRGRGPPQCSLLGATQSLNPRIRNMYRKYEI